MRLAFPGLMAILAERVTIVTPTSTLASVAIEQFNRQQLALGKSSWERPAIYSLYNWMTNSWQDARFSIPNTPLLLSATQERELWRQIIATDRPDLFDIRAMAAMSQRASQILAEYQIPADGEAWLEHADAREFSRWYKSFQRRLKAENWIAQADLWRLLPGLLKPESVAFVALTATSPGLKAICRALGDTVQNIGISYTNQPAIANALAFESTDQEFEHVARSVRYLLETEKAESIGILVADLSSQADALTRALQEVLYPSSLEGSHLHVQTGNLIENPLISNALLLLELAQPRIHHASAGAILRSPFIDGARQERSLRAMADAKLHRARELDFSESEIEKAVWDCPILYQVLRKISRITQKLGSTLRLSAWSAAFSDILEAAKWPALEHITEAEQADADSWSDALSALASLGLVSPPVSLNQALAHLRSILSHSSELGTWSSPVQILDANSSEAIEFSHAFILNATEDAWPAPLALSPLIPYRLQRLHQVPASHPEAVAEDRDRRANSLFTSAERVHLSHTGNLAPALRSHTTVAASNSLAIWSGATEIQSYSAAEIESQDDSQAPPLEPSEQVTGGAGIIKSQSLCPFRAFAEYRLNARGEDEASIGFDALERGECAHKALESIWRELGTQQTLKSFSDDDLLALVEKHVEQAVREDSASGPIRALTSLAERDRLVSVVQQWLRIDKERSMPFVVEKLEEKREAELAGLKLNLRMDRVDRLANGSLLLIDYKSGIQSAKKLEGNRPKEPQLLVYAAAMDEPIDGLYFGELKNRKARPVGHGLGKHFPKQRSTEEHGNDWDQFLAASRDAVHHLAEEFVQGNASVAPQKDACGYCKVKPICRIGAASVAEDDEE